MENILRAIIVAGEMEALPVGVTWPLHRAVALLYDECERQGLDLRLQVTVRPDPGTYSAVDGLESAFAKLQADGFLEKHGSGYAARWVVSPAVVDARRLLMRERAEITRVLSHAGHRLAKWASTALKNADTAAESWASTVQGPIPAVRHPALVALR